MEEMHPAVPQMPADAQKFIEQIARKCSWRRGIRNEVRRELAAHFEDALSAVVEAEKDAAIQELIKDFGDPALLAALIGRGKRRCQPWWERALIMSVKVTAVLLVFGIAADIVLSKRSGEALQEEIARLRSTGAPTSVQEVIEQAQKNNGANALSWEERLKRCPATALLYELSSLKINMDAEVRGKRILDMDRSSASITQLCDTWDAETAAAVGETLSRNREAIDKVRALAILPPDDPADTIWFQTEYWPEECRELGLPRSGVMPIDLDMIASSDDLICFLDVGFAMTLGAVEAMQKRRQDAALDNATAVMALSNHVAGASRTLAGTMVAVALRSMALTSIAQPLLNRADVSEDASARFLDMTSQIDCAKVLAKSFAWERMLLLSGLKKVENGEHVFATGNDNDSLFSRLCKTPLDPLVLRARLLPFLHNEDAMTTLGLKNRLVEAAALPYPEYKARTSSLRDDLKTTSAWTTPIARATLAFHLFGTKDDITVCQANEDLARAAFALRRFKIVRDAYPETLQTLAPEFLPEMPMDRFTGRPLLYRKEGEGCICYSVGINLRDDDGKQDKDSENRDRADDIVWKLTR